MKVSKQQLNNIIKEELAILLKEEQLDEGFLDRLLGRKRKLPKPKASGQVAADVSRFSFGRSAEKKPDQENWIDVDLSDEEEKQKEEQPEVVAVGAGTTEPSYTSSTIPSAGGAATQTAGPGETATTATTQPATDQPAQSQSQKPKVKVNVLSAVEDEPEIFDKYSAEKMKTGTEQFKKTFSELSRILKSELENYGVELTVIKQFLGALSTSLNKDLTSLTLNEEQDELMISNLINKYFSGGSEEKNKLSPVKIRNILKIIKNWAKENSSFVQDKVEPNPGIELPELPKKEKPEDNSFQQSFRPEDITGMYENKYSNFYNKWQKFAKG